MGTYTVRDMTTSPCSLSTSPSKWARLSIQEKQWLFNRWVFGRSCHQLNMSSEKPPLLSDLEYGQGYDNIAMQSAYQPQQVGQVVHPGETVTVQPMGISNISHCCL